MARNKSLEQIYRFRKRNGHLEFESRYYAEKFLQLEYIPKYASLNDVSFEIRKEDDIFVIYRKSEFKV